DNVALHPASFEQPMHPEAVQAGLLDHDNLNRSSNALFSPTPQARKKVEQRGSIPAGNTMLRQLLGARCQRGHEPRRATQFQRDSEPGVMGVDGGLPLDVV